MPTVHEEADGSRTVSYSGEEIDALLNNRPRWRVSFNDLVLGPLALTWGVTEQGRIRFRVFWRHRRLV